MRLLALGLIMGMWTAAYGHHSGSGSLFMGVLIRRWSVCVVVAFTAILTACSIPDVTVVDDTPVCTQTTCGDQCVDLMTDVNNCGACGHVCGCGSTSCTAGICDAHVLAANQGAPVVLALHNDKLYWGNDVDRTVSTVPVAGGTASVLYPGHTQVRGFAFDATRVYLTRFVFNIVESGALDGSGTGNFTNAREPGAAGIATDANAVYWATYDGSTTGLIRTSPLGARGTGATLVTGQVRPDGVAVDAASIYWTTNNPTTGTVMKVPLAGGTPVPLAETQASPHSIAVAGGFVYWTNQGDGTPNTGLFCPIRPHLIDLIRPTRRHNATSPHGG